MSGNILQALKDESGAKAVCGVDLRAAENASVPVYASFNDVKEPVDAIIDFSSPAALKQEMQWAVERNCPVVSAVTGYSENDIKLINECAKKIAVFRTANFSIGINLLLKLARKAAEILGEDFDAEIIEKHHNKKADAPSGTALMLADAVNEAYGGGKEYLYGRRGNAVRRKNEIGIHAVRGGNIVGEHEILFAGTDETVTLSHSAASRSVFAKGAVKAALWLAGKPAGLYGMDDMLQI